MLDVINDEILKLLSLRLGIRDNSRDSSANITDEQKHKGWCPKKLD